MLLLSPHKTSKIINYTTFSFSMMKIQLIFSFSFILSSFVCSCAHMYATYNILWVRFHLCPDPSPPLAFRSRVLVPGHVYVRKNSFEFSTCLFKLSKLQGKQQRSINYTSLTFCSTPSPALAADCTYTRDGE